MSPAKQAEAVNGMAADEVLTLAEVAALLRVPPDDVVRAADRQGLPGRMIGSEWRFAKADVLRWLGKRSRTLEEQKAAQMALAGKFADDPDLMPMLEEAMRRRGREPGPDGTYAGYRPADEGSD